MALHTSLSPDRERLEWAGVGRRGRTDIYGASVLCHNQGQEVSHMPSFNAQEDDCLRGILLAPLVADGRGELKEVIYGDKMTAGTWQSGKSSPGAPL